MNANTPPSDAHHAGDAEEPSQGPRKIPSLASLFHILWLRKWVALSAWLVLAIPTFVLLSIFNLPRSYSSTTVMRFPEVIGAQTNVMRDVAITAGQSILAILNSHLVLEATITKLYLRMRITTPEIFKKQVCKDLKYGDNLEPGLYTIQIRNRGTEAVITYLPSGANSGYQVFGGPVQAEGRISMPGLELQFTPEFLSGKSGDKVELTFAPFDQTIQNLRKALTARPLGGGNFELKLNDRDPWMVAEILSTLQSEFLEVYYGTTEVQDVGILVQMENDLALAKERLEKSQDEISRYYAEHPELTPQAAPVGDNLAYLDSRQTMEMLQQQKKRITQVFAAREAGAAPEKEYYWAMELLNAMSEAGEAKASILRSSLQEVNVRQDGYRATLGPEHPRIKEAEAEKASLYQQIVAVESALLKRLDQELAEARLRMTVSAPRQANRLPVKLQLELERLTNVNKNSQNIYDRLLESYNRAKLVTGSEFFKVSVVDPARPAIYKAPSTKNRLIIAIAAVMFLLVLVPGLVLVWGLVFIRIWTKDDVRRLLGMRTAGIIAERKIKWSKAELASERKATVDPRLVVHGQKALLEDIEAFRIVREEIENNFRNPAAPGRFCMMVTSSRPHEGKSTCAANLAVTFARKGKRTLLVDADFRLGRVARIFNLSVATGLDTILDQSDINHEQFLETASLVYLPTVQRNLVVAPRKSPNANASELISSDRFKAFIKLVREQFEVVIIDTPPVMITPEPLALAEHTDGVLFVCRSGVTAASEAREGVGMLRERNQNIMVILNGSKNSPFEENRYKKYAYYYQVQPSPEGETD